MTTWPLYCRTCSKTTTHETKYNKRRTLIWSKCQECGAERNHWQEMREIRNVLRGEKTGGMNHGHLRVRRARSGY